MAEKHGCKFCTTPCDRFGSGEVCPPHSKFLVEHDEAKAESLEIHEGEIDLSSFDFGEEDSFEPPVDSSNLDLIPDCNTEDELDTDGLEDEAVQAYLNGEDSDDEVVEESYVKSMRETAKGQVKHKHDLQNKQSLEAKVATNYRKAKKSVNSGDAKVAAIKVNEARKSLKKLEARQQKRESSHRKAKKT